MIKFERQFDLFKNNDLDFLEENNFQDIYIDKKIIKEWQRKIIRHQSPIFKYGNKNITQSSLFEPPKAQERKVTFNPIELTPLP